MLKKINVEYFPRVRKLENFRHKSFTMIPRIPGDYVIIPGDLLI
jgi:hypothetical protein